MQLAFLLLLLLPTVVMASNAQDQSSPWRCAENGGINVLYIYLKVLGVPCRYSELQKEQLDETGRAAHSAATLACLARKHGASLCPVSLTMKQLSSCNLPVIVHLDLESPDAGVFMLVTAVSAQRIVCVDGPSATMRGMALEDFRRVWSGVAMLPSAEWPWAAIFCGLGFGVGSLAPLRFRMTRFKGNS